MDLAVAGLVFWSEKGRGARIKRWENNVNNEKILMLLEDRRPALQMMKDSSR